MKAITFPQVNLMLAEDQPEYETLPVHVVAEDPTTPMTCCLELSPEEVEEIVRTGRIYHTQLTFGGPVQPIRMSVTNPFD
jgi:hypothetical protein